LNDLLVIGDLVAGPHDHLPYRATRGHSLKRLV
jgi:hypothetical protein